MCLLKDTRCLWVIIFGWDMWQGHVDKVVSYNLLPFFMSESGTGYEKWGSLRQVGDGGLRPGWK